MNILILLRMTQITCIIKVNRAAQQFVFLKDMMIILCYVDKLQTNFMYQKWVKASELIMSCMWSYFLQGPLYRFHSGSGMDITVSQH